MGRLASRSSSARRYSDWRTDDTGEIERRAKDTARAIYREAEAATSAARRKELASHAVRSEAASKIAAMITLA